MLSVIDKHIVIEKEKSKERDLERRMEYQNQKTDCPYCGEIFLRKTLYKHTKNCILRNEKIQ